MIANPQPKILITIPQSQPHKTPMVFILETMGIFYLCVCGIMALPQSKRKTYPRIDTITGCLLAPGETQYTPSKTSRYCFWIKLRKSLSDKLDARSVPHSTR